MISAADAFEGARLGLKDALREHGRVMVLGYPGSGKTTLVDSVEDRPVLHLDYVQETRWSPQWVRAATDWCMARARWCVEGTMGYRLVRTWLHFGGPLPEIIVMLHQPASPQTMHDAFCKGIETVWREAQAHPRFSEMRIVHYMGLPPRPEKPEFQLAGRLKTWPAAGLFIIEGKIDGVRFGALRRGGKWEFYNRIGRCKPPRHIEQAVPELPEGSWLDGEYDSGYGEQAGYEFLLAEEPPELGEWAIFDFTTYPPRKAFATMRKMWLDAAMGEAARRSDAIRLVEYAVLDARQLKSAAKRLMSAEGVVIKEAHSHYRPRTRKGWYKLKRDVCQASLW